MAILTRDTPYNDHYPRRTTLFHGIKVPTVSPAEAGSATTPYERMAQTLGTAAGRKLYAARKHIVEPVFGQIKHVRGFRKFMLRGLEKVAAEWKLVCLTHNILKIWRFAKSPT